jgi:hypothetical protein
MQASGRLEKQVSQCGLGMPKKGIVDSSVDDEGEGEG